jgi:hypothetical protein
MRACFVIISLLIYSCAGVGQAPASTPGSDSLRFKADDSAHLLDGEFFIEKTVAGLPVSIKSALAALFGEKNLTMANPGQKFNAGDFMAMEAGPPRRLIFAGNSKDKWLIHYEKGGRSHFYYVVIFRLDVQQRATILWAGAYGAPARDVEQLRSEPHWTIDKRSRL